MSRPNYSRAVREAAERIPHEVVVIQPHIVTMQMRVDELEARHSALCAQHLKVRARGQALEERIEALKIEVAKKTRSTSCHRKSSARE